jgi:hypothetical protein
MLQMTKTVKANKYLGALLVLCFQIQWFENNQINCVMLCRSSLDFASKETIMKEIILTQ